MTIQRIEEPLDGERVVALSPEDATLAATDWLRRPNLFAGRALTAPTLQGRQRWQAGRIAQRGQALTPGVVRGLEVSWVGPAVARPPDEVRLLIESGQGLAVGGEDVMLVRRVECWLQDLPVAAPPDWLLPVDTDAGPTGEAAVPGTLHPRVVADDKRLADVRASAGDRMLRIGVLVLQPVTVERSSFDPNDPCDLCPCGEGEGEGEGSNVASFQDWRSTDGARLLWYPWPQEWMPLPGTSLRLRNALAHRIFDAEAALAHGEALPWEAWGVPIALAAVDANWKPLWMDRAAVVRQGGRAREARLQLAPGAGMRLAANSRLPALWQARIEQFAEQMAESGDPLPPPQLLADPYLQLPPCGLLPKSALDLGNFRSPFFPPIFELDAVPVPMEQLDLALRESAALAALDMSSPERLRLLVPVTQASWEPRLLFKDAVDAEFQQTLDEFLLTRSRVLGLRQGLRWKEAVLLHAIDGVAPSVPAFSDDVQALEPESLSPWGEPPAGGGHRSALLAGIHQHYFDGANPGLAVKAGDALFAWVCLDPDNPPRTVVLQWHTADGWEHRAYWGENLIPWGTAAAGPSHFPAGPLPTPGQWLMLQVPADKLGLAGQTVDGMGFTLYDGRAAYGLAGTRNGNAQVKWFCNALPAGVSLQGNEGWDFLTANDLWAPFELRYGVVPSLADPVDAAASPDALFRTPIGGFNVSYPLATGWRGHRVPLDTEPGPGPLRLQLSANEAIVGKLFCSVYLDEMTPPSALWVSISLSVFGDEMSFWDQNAFWGENHLDELAKVAPELAANRTPALRAGALPRSSRWVQIEIPLPAERAPLAIYEVRFMAYGGALAISDLTFGRPTAPAVAGEPWVLKPELAWPRRKADNSLHAPFSKVLSQQEVLLTTGEGVLTPTIASRIGTAPVYADLAGDAQMARLSQHERSQLQLRGLNRFGDYLRERIDRTDDITDFGFAHMQVDMHRMRQLMMSTTDASRLAISPALAAIAKSDSALTVQSQIKEYLTKVKIGPLTRSASVAEIAVPRAFTVKASFSAVASNVQAVKASSLAMLIQPPRAPLNIVYANPVVGLSPIRTVAIADRLKQPPSTEARDYALSNRHRTVLSLVGLLDAFMAEDSGEVPAMFDGFEVIGLSGDPFLPANTTRRKLTDFLADRALLQRLLNPPPTLIRQPDGTLKEGDPDEPALFTQTVSLSDNTIAMLRQLEGRLAVYREALQLVEAALAELQGSAQAIGLRRQQTEDLLAEARHDVGVARALLAEEEARIAAINARRERVLDEEVQYLAFVRPRETNNEMAAPRRVLDPGLIEAPVPACLRAHDDVPGELDEMLKVLREAPAAYFVGAPKIIRKIDRPELLLRTLKSAQLRSTLITQRAIPAVAPGTGRLGVHIGQMLTRHTQAIGVRAEAVQRLDLQRLASSTWQGVQREAQEVISLGDIIDGDHGKGEVARLASELFERIAGVCACLHAEFSGVLPSVRLDWAEVMSQFDEAPNLRNLGGLPRWSAIGYVDRRQMQAYADFLFDQMQPNNTSAVALINDVVRMALLLASHAPVGRIIAGRMPRPVTGVRVGSRIPLTALDPARLRVGMQAMLYKGAVLMARATVEDVGQGEVSARLVHTSSVQIDLDTDVRVHFDQAKVLSAAPSRSGSIFKR